MATINNKNGKLQLDFRYKGKRCREQTKLEDNQANRRRTKKILDRIDAEITLGTFVYADYFPNSKKAVEFEELNKRISSAKEGISNTPTFADFSDTWLNEKQIEWRDSHMISVVANLGAYTLPEFGERDVSSITKAQILNFRSTLAKEPKRKKSPLNPATINKIMTPLRMMLNEAADRYEFTSPFLGIKSLKTPRIDVEPFSIEEVQLILKTVRKDFLPYYTTRFFTGMRTGEIDGLQWRYVDFKKRLILVRETIVKGKVSYTKNDGSQREIQISQPVIDALKQQEEITGGQKFVFQNTAGSTLAHNNVTKRVWYPLLRYLNLKARRPYQSRHTAATLWLAAGENPEWIARQMGHTTTEMLFRIYSRYVPNLTRQDGSAFERLLTTNFSESGEHNE